MYHVNTQSAWEMYIIIIVRGDMHYARLDTTLAAYIFLWFADFIYRFI